MFVLPKGTLVKVGGMPFRLLDDVQTDGLEVNYRLAMEGLGTGIGESALIPNGVDGVDGRPIPCGNKAALGIDNA